MHKIKLKHLLIALIVVVLFMMQIGAITRLTGSGLSIPEWPLINGSLLYPVSDQAWNEVFEIYKQYPQYHLINKGMSLEDFKWIFFFEYFHRAITTVVSLILLFIVISIFRNPELRDRYRGGAIWLSALLIAQAVAGALMVKSGLEPGMASVSHLNLATHLMLATLFLSVSVWMLMRIRFPNRISMLPGLSPLWVRGFLLLIGIQIISGAFMAGTKAGFTFNDWPYMNGQLIPDYLFVSHDMYASNWFLNFTDNIVNIHFMHRLIAYLLLGLGIWIYIRLKPIVKQLEIPRETLLGLLIFQVLLGIITLVFHVPVALGTLHQLGAILVWLYALYLNHKVRTA